MRIKPNRIEGLDIARGFAVVMVVLLHAAEVVGNSGPIGSVNAVFGGIRMPLLLLISGMLTASMLGSRERLVTRTAQFFWVFALWSLIAWLVTALLAHAAPRPASLLAEITRPTTTLWFVWALGLMTASLPLLRAIPRPIQLLAAAAISMAVYADLIHTSVYTYDHLLRQGFFFYLGVYAAAPLMALLRRPLLPALGIALAAFVALRMIDAPLIDATGWRVLTVPERFAATMATLYAAGLAAQVASLARPLVWLGRNTLPIFVGHGLFLMFAATTNDFSRANGLVIAPVLTVFAITGALLLRAALVRAGLAWLYLLPEALRIRLSSTLTAQSAAGKAAAIAR